MNSQAPGPKPEPEAEPGEVDPGGADAVHHADGAERSDAVPADLDPSLNPAVDDALPDEMRQGEDTDTKATREDEDADDVDPEDESPV
ncbi:hypothetical protein [Nocardioides sp. AX2bis]|uniref:hypothetical protein n=1 Tax=Nocardioides sp. AX2bis TaxID=2653157 RepID=UPI0012F46307|nr:hypothetical protein [Nocardioides sp. AX2bis]VXB66485.1 conserved hypothetical protein [Nocardioides sp. AX2bis]